MTAGEHLFVWRFDTCVPYQHHGIDIGDGTVVHYAGPDGRGARASGKPIDFQVRRTDLAQFVGCRELSPDHADQRSRLYRVKHSDGRDPDEVITRALGEVGRGNYSVAFRNCEHFATWACTDSWNSNQIDVFVERSAAIAAKTALAIGSRLARRGFLRGVHPTVVVGDAVQFVVESLGPHAGLHDVQRRKRVGRGASLTTCVALGATAGPAGALAAGACWGVGEFAGVGCRRVMNLIAKRRKPA